MFTIPKWTSTGPVGVDIDYEFIEEVTLNNLAVNTIYENQRDSTNYISGYLIYDMVPKINLDYLKKFKDWWEPAVFTFDPLKPDIANR